MALDKHANFAYSTVASAPSPATSGTSLVVQSGDGAKFPATPFNAVVWPANTQPTTANAEIVRVSGVSTDTFTITRNQEGSNNRSIQVGDQISNNITLKWFTDIESLLLPTTDVAGTTQAAVSNNAYIADNASQVVITLPTTALVGDVIRIVGKGAGGWKLAQNASQIVHFGSVNTTSGVGGSLTSNTQYDCINIQCSVTNNEWVVFHSVGNLAIV